VSGSQVFYADAPVIIAQNTNLSGVRTITIAPTGPGVTGAPGTGVVNRITGNLSGVGAPRFATFDPPQGSGLGFSESAELVLAGTDNWTGNPGTIQNTNAGSGGLILDQNTLIRFASNASLPTGNGGTKAFLAAIRDNATSYAGGFLLTAGDTYTLAPGYSFLFGDSVPYNLGGSANSNPRVSILGSTSDTGTGGTATLLNAPILIVNASLNTGTSPANLNNAQTLSLLVRDGELVLGGATPVTFQAGTDAAFAGSNLFAGDFVVNPLIALSVSDSPATANLRTIEKIGGGTATLGNVAYAVPVAGTDASADFTWNIGNTSQTAFGGAVRETSETVTGGQNLANVRVNLAGGVIEIGAAGGANGDFTRSLGTGIGQVNLTAGGGFSAYGGNRTVNLGGVATPATLQCAAVGHDGFVRGRRPDAAVRLPDR
jgi:hypothetical protein